MITVSEAKAIVLGAAAPLGPIEVTLAEAVGRVLAEPIRADQDLPPFDNSAMDGYAVQSLDTRAASPDHPVRLKVIGDVSAGSWREVSLRQGEALKINTGAAVPPGADTVVKLEDAKLRDGWVEISGAVPAGRHVRAQGEDIRAGSTALESGAQIKPAHMGLLASLGKTRLRVFRDPKVAILATGSELVDISQPPGPGQIRNSNSVVLKTYLARMGFPVIDLGTVGDDRAEIRERIERAGDSDVLLVSGGVSVGEHDLVKRVLGDLGFRQLFWRVQMKPGKPLLFGTLGKTTVFGIPGNPVSCVVGFKVFIEPFLRTLRGESPAESSTREALLAEDLDNSEGKARFVTARLEEREGAFWAAPTSKQGSGMLTSLAQADGLIVVGEDQERILAGEKVQVILINA